MISILWFVLYTLIYLGIGYSIFAIVFKVWKREPNVPHEAVSGVAEEFGTTTERLYGFTRALMTIFWPVYCIAVPIIAIKTYKEEKSNGKR